MTAAGKRAWEERYAGKLKREKEAEEAKEMEQRRLRERAAAKARMDGTVPGVVRQEQANRAEKMYNEWKSGALNNPPSTVPGAPPPAPPRAVPPAPPPEDKRPAEKASSSSEGIVVDSLLAEVEDLKKKLSEKNDEIVELVRAVEHWKLRFEQMEHEALNEMMARENSRAM